MPRRPQNYRVSLQTTNVQADRLREVIWYYLTVLEQYRNPRSAPKEAIPTTTCRGGQGGEHQRTVRFASRTGGQVTRLSCSVPRGMMSDDVLQTRVLQPLREDGFTVGAVNYSSCGCALFTIRPRTLA